jgi:hypothetical protein
LHQRITLCVGACCNHKEKAGDDDFFHGKQL